MNIIATNVSLTNLGVNNGAAAAAADGKYTYDEMTALFMKKFSGEVYNAMRRKCLFKTSSAHEQSKTANQPPSTTQDA